MSRSVDRRRRMVRRHDEAQLGLMLRPAIQRQVHGHLLLADHRDAHLRRALLPRRVRARAEDGRLAQRALEPAQDDRVEVVRLERRRERDAVAWAVARAGAVDGEHDAVLREVPRLGLCVHGPGGVQLVFVDDDRRGRRDERGLAAPEETSVVSACVYACVRVQVQVRRDRVGWTDGRTDRSAQLGRWIWATEMETHFLPFTQTTPVSSYLTPAEMIED